MRNYLIEDYLGFRRMGYSPKRSLQNARTQAAFQAIEGHFEFVPESGRGIVLYKRSNIRGSVELASCRTFSSHYMSLSAFLNDAIIDLKNVAITYANQNFNREF